jgi:hypothetical protein
VLVGTTLMFIIIIKCNIEIAESVAYTNSTYIQLIFCDIDCTDVDEEDNVRFIGILDFADDDADDMITCN